MIETAIVVELSAAIDAVNATFNRLPEAERPDPAARQDLDRELDVAITSGDPERALAAIVSWRDHWLGEFEAVANG